MVDHAVSSASLQTIAAEIPKILQRMQGARVTLFGDFCLDAYWEPCENSSQSSVQTGLPVRHVKSQRYSLGGAGSVLANLVQMGVGTVRAVGLAGTDMFGGTLRALLERSGADMEGFLFDSEFETLVYAKPIMGQREESRIDFGTFTALRPGLLTQLLSNLRAAVAESDVVILNQQVKTSLSSVEAIDCVNQIIWEHPSKIFIVDARHTAMMYRGAQCWFDAERKPVFFPFGFGLSYTSFAYSGLQVSTDGSQVSVTVTNSGQCTGLETAEIYAALPATRENLRSV